MHPWGCKGTCETRNISAIYLMTKHQRKNANNMAGKNKKNLNGMLASKEFLKGNSTSRLNSVSMKISICSTINSTLP